MAGSLAKVFLFASLWLVLGLAQGQKVVKMPLNQKRNATSALYKRAPFAIGGFMLGGPMGLEYGR